MEPFSKTIDQLREWDVDVWKKTEALVPKNCAIFASLMGIHFDLIVRAHETNPNARHRLDRALRLMAARCAHLLRAAWIASMAGYPGSFQPLVRALYETSLTMHYIRTFPDDFGIWTKRDKTSRERERFHPTQMMNRLRVPQDERLIWSRLAEAAHPNPPSLSRLAGYDPESDTLEISIGHVPSESDARRLSADVCLFAALSAYNIARTVKDALVDGLPSHLEEFLARLNELVTSREKEPAEGTAVFDLFAKKTRK